MCHGCGLRCATSRNVFGPYLFVTGTDKAGRNDDSVPDGVRILIYRVGGHALASPEGGGSCSLGTHYLLELQRTWLTDNLNTTTKRLRCSHRSRPIGYGPTGYGDTVGYGPTGYGNALNNK